MATTAGGGQAIRRLETLGAAGVVVAGAFLHFAYDLSGGSPVVAALAPRNESVWEHLKMVLVPVLVLGAVQARWMPDQRRLWWAKLAEIVAASGFIVAFFYTYTGALGVESIVVVDVGSFVVAIAGAQWLSYRIITARTSRTAPLAVSVTALVLLVVGFAVLTFVPPPIPLFQEVGTATHGTAAP